MFSFDIFRKHFEEVLNQNALKNILSENTSTKKPCVPETRIVYGKDTKYRNEKSQLRNK